MTAPPAEGRRGRNPLRGFSPPVPKVRLWRLNPQKLLFKRAGDKNFLIKGFISAGLIFGAVPTLYQHSTDNGRTEKIAAMIQLDRLFLPQSYQNMENSQVEKLIGSKIKKLRQKNNLTQEKLAIKAGVPYTTLTKIESGVIKKPAVQTVAKIAKALGVTIDNLLK